MTAGAIAATSRGLWQRLRRTSPTQAAILGAAIAFMGLLAIVPLAYLLWFTFVGDGSLTLENFRSAYDARFGFGRLSLNTLWFTLGSSAIALPIGTALAYLNVRTNVPLRRLVFVVSLIPLIIPGILHTIAWIFLASPRIGLVNKALEPVFGPGTIDIFSMTGMSLVEGLHVTPIVFLVMVASFRSIDPALEESALLSGASRTRVLLRIALPLAKPGLAAATLLMVVNGVSSFEVPALLGIPSGIWVFTSRIWRSLSTFPVAYGEAGAYAVSLLAMTSVGVWLQSRLSRGRDFQTVTGKGFRPGSMDLGRWRWPAAGFVAGFTALAVVLPLLVLLYLSTQPFYSVPSLDSLSRMSLDNYRFTLALPQVGRALRNSLLLGVSSATLVMFLMAIVSWIVVRTRIPGRWTLDSLASFPLAIPGLVMGVSVLFVYLRAPIPVYGTMWILLIAYLTKYLPYGIRYASTSMHQIGAELEESAAISGASWWQQFRRVTLPLVMPGLVSGWIYVLMVSVRELSSSILLYSPGTEVLSIVIWEQWENGATGVVASLGVMMIIGLVVLVAIGARLGARVGVRGT